MPDENLSTTQSYNNLAIIWGGLFSSQFVFLIVIFVLKPELMQFDLRKPLLGENAPVILIFAIMGVSSLLLSLFLKSKFLNQSVEEQKPALVQTAMIIGCALCEAVTLFGFLLAFAFDYQYFFIWFALGLFGMILHFPKRENLHLATFKKTQ